MLLRLQCHARVKIFILSVLNFCTQNNSQILRGSLGVSNKFDYNYGLLSKDKITNRPDNEMGRVTFEHGRKEIIGS